MLHSTRSEANSRGSRGRRGGRSRRKARRSGDRERRGRSASSKTEVEASRCCRRSPPGIRTPRDVCRETIDPARSLSPMRREGRVIIVSQGERRPIEVFYIRYLTDSIPESPRRRHDAFTRESSGEQTRSFSVKQSIVPNGPAASCPSFSEDKRQQDGTKTWIRGRRVVSNEKEKKKKRKRKHRKREKKKIVPCEGTSQGEGSDGSTSRSLRLRCVQVTRRSRLKLEESNSNVTIYTRTHTLTGNVSH